MSDLGNKEAMAANIKRLLHQFGKTRQQLSEGTGINYQTISSWMSRKSYPRIDNLERMANYFNVPKTELVESEKSRDALKRSEKYPYAFINIPVIGSIACGEPITAEQNVEGYIPEPFFQTPSGTIFALHCKGHSMEPTIPDGAIVVVREQPEV